MSESTSAQRTNWKAFECAEPAMARIAFGPDEILVAPPTTDAWRALALVLGAHGYEVRTADTDSYNCRAITGGSDKSLHAYGIALDVNWTTNPYRETPNQRKVVFSQKPTQAERAQEVKRNLADTDMTRAMIDDVLAIKTIGGKRVFEWGGNWVNVKDTMHFEIDVTPQDLATGIDWNTVRGAAGAPPPPDLTAETRAGGQAIPAGLVLGSFDKVHALIEKWEGGYTNHPSDPGGPTNRGITLKVLEQWRQRPVGIDDVRNLSRDEALQIFRAHYWTPVHGDDIPLPAAQVVYNTAVLSGPGRAARLLQQALTRKDARVAVDSRIGPQTIAACLAADQKRLVEDFCALYESYLRALPTFATFGRGWLNRLAEIRKAALEWAEAPPVAVVEGAPPPLARVLQFGDQGIEIEALQRRLTALGYPLGEIDGRFGTLTREALLAFQADNDVIPSGAVDAATAAAFARPQSRPLSRERVAATPEDLRERGSQTIKAADNTKIVGWLSSLFGALGITNSAAVQLHNTGTAAAAPPIDLPRFLADVQQLLTSPQALGNADQVQKVLDAAKQLQTFNTRQLLSPENIQLFDTIRALIPADAVSANSGLAAFFQQIDTLRAAAPQIRTIVDVLPTFFADGTALQLVSKGLAVAATSVIPGFGGSLAALGIGLAANYFGNRIIEARTRDHNTGANTNR